VIPEPIISEDLMTIPGTDGQKMSKSYNNIIDIFLPDKQLKKQVLSIVTDSTPLEEPKNPDTCTVFALYKILASPDRTAEMRQNYLGGNYGYGHAKQELFEVITKRFSRERELFNEYHQNTDLLEEKLQKGEKRASQIASVVLNKVRSKLGYL
jgi:tryptophanyl-tRNA synthetase